MPDISRHPLDFGTIVTEQVSIEVPCPQAYQVYGSSKALVLIGYTLVTTPDKKTVLQLDVLASAPITGVLWDRAICLQTFCSSRASKSSVQLIRWPVGGIFAEK